METVFLKILNMSIHAGWLVLAVMVLRLVFQKAPKAITVLMWALVGIRLLCPFTLESALSLLPSGETVPEQFLSTEAEKITLHLSGQIDWTEPVIDSETVPAPQPEIPSSPSFNLTQVIALVWLVGVAMMLCYAAFSYLRVRRSVREGMHLRERVWLCDHISSPFILGVFRPRIYVPSGMGAVDLEYVLAHENAHLKRKDHWWKPLGFLLLCVHWFNPLLWLGYIFLCRDIEFACDEAVLRKLGMESKKPYSEALLSCSISRRMLSACPLAFGEVGVKTRIRSVLHYKKPALWIILAAVLTCIAVAVCFLTDPKTDPSERLHDTVRSIILSHHRSEYFIDNVCCTEYEVLGMEEEGNTTTLYLSVMYQEYRLRNGAPYKAAASHQPEVITLVEEDGRYTLKEYWQPTDSIVYYKKNVCEKFPDHLQDQALNKQQYAHKLQQSCDRQGKAQYQKPGDHQVGKLVQDADVRRKYPRYFGLSTEKGLEVCVWQTAENQFSWALVEGKNREFSTIELLGMRGTTLQEMQTIVASYGLEADGVSVRPIVMPNSKYFYSVDPTYQQMVEQMFRECNQALLHPAYHAQYIDTMTFDIDGDGVEECCTLTPGSTDWGFSFTLSVTEKGKPEYYNTYTGSFAQLRFDRQPDGQVWLRAPIADESISDDHFRFQVRKGNIVLIPQKQPCGTCRQPSCLISPPDESEQKLAYAIAAALQSNHGGEAADGGICTQSYAVVDEKWTSQKLSTYGAPLRCVTLCLLVQQMEYAVDGAYPRKIRGQAIPTVLTFVEELTGNFQLMEYQDRAETVQSQFPEAANSEKYAAALEDQCHILALQQQLWQQGRLGESYDVWKEQYISSMEVKDFS